MSEWNDDNLPNENDVNGNGVPGTNGEAPENRTEEGVPEENGAMPEAGGEDSGSPEKENEPQETPPAAQPQSLHTENIWAYSWDGSAQNQKKKGKGTKAFFIIAAICLILCVAICVPTILYSLRHPGAVTETSKPETSASNTSSAPSESEKPSGTSEPSYEVSETVKPSGKTYLESSDLIELYEKCSKSCLTIYASGGSGSRTTAYIGSGFVLTEDGYIATNQHLVEGCTSFTVTFYDGTEYDAKLIGADSTRDLAVLKIEAKNLQVLEIGDSSTLKPGQTVVTIGTPYSFELAGTITRGIISGVNREIQMTDDYGRATKTMTLIQTDASINPGNSGGPMLNMAGQVVGINFMKLTSEYESLAFAIPINYAVKIFNQLIQYGSVVQDPEDDFVSTRARIGVEVYDVETGLNEKRLKPTCDYPKKGTFVSWADPATGAYKAGLRSYDIIVEFNGVEIENRNTLTKELAKYKAGDTVTMKIFTFNGDFSAGDYKTITFKLDAVQ